MKRILLSLFAFCCSIGFAQDGSFDTSFGDNGVVRMDINEMDNWLNHLTFDPNGKIIITGVNFDINNSSEFYFLGAFHDDGTLDLDFGQNGFVIHNENEAEFGDLIVQSTRKILVSTTNPNTITRYLPNGEIDLSFGDNGSIFPITSDESGGTLKLDNQDSFRLSGTKYVDGNFTVFEKKFLENGTVDNTFGVNGVRYFTVQEAGDAYLLSSSPTIDDGKLISYRLSNLTPPKNLIKKYLADGELDLSFGNNGVVEVPIENVYYCSCQLFADQSIWVGCKDFQTDPFVVNKKSLKLRPNGSLDEGFASQGILDGYTIGLLQGNQKYIADDGFDDFEGGTTIAFDRFQNNGTLDSTFQFDGFSEELSTPKIYTTPSGQLLVASNTMWYNAAIDIVLLQYNNNPLAVNDFVESPVAAFPNPSTGIFTITSKNELIGEPFSVFDLSGKLLMEGRFETTNPQLDLTIFESGLYFLKIKQQTIKLIKN